MTEDEAKTKWCPFVRAWEGAGSSWSTRPLSGPEDSGLMTAQKVFCIGSDCMAWRWEGKPSVVFTGTEQTLRGHEPEPRELLARGWREIARHKNGEGPQANQCRDCIEWEAPGEGFCGLAGASQ